MTVHSNRRFTRRDFLRLSSVAAGSLLAGAAPRRASRRGRATATLPNVVLVIVDAVRADHVSSNGYVRATTPNLDSWVASQGVSFTGARSVSSWTFPANASMMTGRNPSRLNATFENTVIPADVPMLAELLRAAGYYIAGFVSAEYVRGWRGFSRGFDVYDEQAVGTSTSQTALAAAVNNRALVWLQTWTPGSQPLFLCLYYFDPHTWYNPPAPYDTLYDSNYAGPLTPDVYRDGQDVVSGAIVPNAEDIEHLLALYDGEITYWDYYFGQMMTELDSRNLLDNALIIVTSDHGDAFGEHGKWNHTNCLYEEILRVPLCMRYDGVIGSGLTVDVPVQNIDLMPTILDWLGIAIPSGVQAVSLRPLAEGQTADARDIFSEMEGVSDTGHWAYWIAPRSDLRAIQRGAWKYIHHVHDPQADELYQLNATSVYETDNMLESQPAMAQTLRDALFAWFGILPFQNYLPYIAR